MMIFHGSFCLLLQLHRYSVIFVVECTGFYRSLLDKERMSVFLAFLRMLDRCDYQIFFSFELVVLLVYSHYFSYILHS